MGFGLLLYSRFPIHLNSVSNLKNNLYEII